MDKRLQKKWVDALRSGQYTQARNLLHPRKESFCVIGLLLNCSNRRKWKKGGSGSYYWLDTPSNLELRGAIVEPIASRIGISLEKSRWLMALNDHGTTFEELARLIEQDPDMGSDDLSTLYKLIGD